MVLVFPKATKELKSIFTIVNNNLSVDNFNSFFKWEYKPRKEEAQLTIFIVNGLEIFNTDRAVPYCVSFYRLGTIARNHIRDLIIEVICKCGNDTIVFGETDCISYMFDWLVIFKGEHRKVTNRIVEFDLQITVQNVSAFVLYNVLNSLSVWHRIVSIVKKWKMFFSLKVFNIKRKIYENRFFALAVKLIFGMTQY